jgi:hypothetical protein
LEFSEVSEICRKFFHAKKNSLPFLNVLEHVRIRVILDTCTCKCPGISDFSDLRQTRCARKISKPVLETYYQRNHVYFGF